MKTQINYGVNRVNPKTKRIEHQNASTWVKGKLSDDDFTRRVLDHVQLSHPGWALTGYAETRPKVPRVHLVVDAYNSPGRVLAVFNHIEDAVAFGDLLHDPAEIESRTIFWGQPPVCGYNQ